MSQEINRLTALDAKNAAADSLLADGGGLYLAVSPKGAKSWRFIFQWGGKRKEMGLGSFLAVDLKAARKKAEDARKQVADGVNPIEARKAQEAVETPQESRRFADVAERFIAWKETDWKKPKYAANWRTMLTRHLSGLAEKDVATLTAEDLANVFKPIWNSLASAKEMRSRVRQILDAAISWRLREAPNPDARLGPLLPKRNHVKVHRAAMPYEHVPRLVRQLQEKDTVSACALEFTILTAVRSAEALGTRKAEIDRKAKLWVIPKERMKAGVEHRVPLAPQVMAIVDHVWALTPDDGFLFPGGHHDGVRLGSKPMAHPALWNLLKRMADEGLTVHGFRSSFADWAADMTDHPYEVREAALAHAVGSQVSRAYRRTDSLDKRRELMAAWANYAAGPKGRGRPSR